MGYYKNNIMMLTQGWQNTRQSKRQEIIQEINDDLLQPFMSAAAASGLRKVDFIDILSVMVSKLEQMSGRNTDGSE